MSAPLIESSRVAAIVKQMQDVRVMVVGDLMLDKFVRGKVERISPEAPIPVVQVTDEEAYPGGASNVARNVSAFGARSGICGVLGKDQAGEELCRLLRKDKIATTGLFIEPQFSTIVKTRVLARQQQVVRVDYEKPLVLGSDDADRLHAFFKRSIPRYDAVIIEDYGKGTVNQEIFDFVVQVAQNAGKIVTVAPNPNNLIGFHDVTTIKPNRAEAFLLGEILVASEALDPAVLAEAIGAQHERGGRHGDRLLHHGSGRRGGRSGSCGNCQSCGRSRGEQSGNRNRQSRGTGPEF